MSALHCALFPRRSRPAWRRATLLLPPGRACAHTATLRPGVRDAVWFGGMKRHQLRQACLSASGAGAACL